jgi:hypothetical protein
MVAIRGHFDGKVIVPDEPVNLPVGQRVRVTPEPAAQSTQVDAGTAEATAKRLTQSAPWAGRTDIGDSLEFARRIREEAQRRNHDDSDR